MIKDTISYKIKFITIYLIAVFLVLTISVTAFIKLSSSDVGVVSKKHFHSKTLEREDFIQNAMYPYLTTIKALATDDILNRYVNKQIAKRDVEMMFLTIKRSLPCLTQVRYIDNNGYEKVKVDGTAIAEFKDGAISRIVAQNELLYKSNKAYVKSFLKLNKGEIGVSKIELYKEFDKVSLPKQPIIRMGVKIYDKQNKPQGLVVINICLKRFFKLLNETTLYHVHLVDGNGKFLNHHSPKYGLMGDNMEYSLKDEFPYHWKQILDKDEFYGDTFYSHKLIRFSNVQELRLLLELKFLDKSERSESIKHFILFGIILFAIVLLPLVIHFSKLPDLLIESSKKETLKDKLSKLPNRLALLEDLSDNQFEDCVIILISFDNIVKVQNTYGYEISNSLVQSISEYLQNYIDDNIQKVYVNSYNIFSLKYKYSSRESLNDFLDNLILSLEHHPFVINDLEILCNCTIGISDPEKLNNSIEELQEAENALDFALNSHLHMDIFGEGNQNTIENNKTNIEMARQIKRAIENNDIVLHYQPIYNNETKKIEKYESLIRMEVNGELIYPDTFLPIAKEVNKYNTLSYMVIDKAFKQFQDLDYEFSINLSILDISNAYFQDYLIERIEHYGIKDKLVLEIVESESINNYEDVYNFIKRVKELGCKIAIDDFGSGYSNFEHIVNLSEYLDYLKLDGSLIKNITVDRNIQILIGSIKYFCDNLGIKTIAEYVDNQEALEYLTWIGVDYSQGFYLGKPSAEILESETN